LLLSTCPNVTVKEGSGSGDILLSIFTSKNSYVHSNVLALDFDNPSEVNLSLAKVLYPNVTQFRIHFRIGSIENLIKFEKITFLGINCLYQNLQSFLRIRGQLLQKLEFRSIDFILRLDLNELASLCPNLIVLTVTAHLFDFNIDGTSFKRLEKLNIQKQDTLIPIIQWFGDFLGSMTSLKRLDIGTNIATFIFGVWIDNVVSYGCFQELEYLHLSTFPWLTVDDLKKWLYACPKIHHFSYLATQLTTITQVQTLTNLEADIKNQNYDLIITGV